MNEKVTNLENGERIAYIFALPYNSSAEAAPKMTGQDLTLM